MFWIKLVWFETQNIKFRLKLLITFWNIFKFSNTYISGILLKCVSFFSWKFWHFFTNTKIMKDTLPEEMHVFFLLECIPLFVFAIRGLRFLYNISSISYVFCNKHFTAFLERQIYKDKPTYLLNEIKISNFYINMMRRPVVFFHN